MPREDQHRTDAMLRGLVGPGRSRLSLSAAMRARDVARVTEADLAWAEETVVLRHAHPVQQQPATAGDEPGGAGRAPGPGAAGRQGGPAATSEASAAGSPGAPAPGASAPGRRRQGSPGPGSPTRPAPEADSRTRERAGRPRRGEARPTPRPKNGEAHGRRGQVAGADGDASGSSPERS
ncbi:hypothetical protein [Frankia sp. EI5c]|uniref:hypothetical protein n=1 Tax=Frankia sp. EI5c TaxID=683316 RepID=UPI000FF898CB|nr:hypothetical protein [Frankia sp. EI5c]